MRALVSGVFGASFGPPLGCQNEHLVWDCCSKLTLDEGSILRAKMGPKMRPGVNSKGPRKTSDTDDGGGVVRLSEWARALSGLPALASSRMLV